ncbi:TPA: EpsG family protein [Klebsiella quasipneumoniae subsp. quasipneumoniae]|nr:EpsG family protein [Klebsiella quasipneumoniae subsp. quasipneumoniae]
MLTIVLSCVVGFKNFYIWRDVDTYWAYYDFAYFYNVSYIFSNVQDPIFTILIKPFVHSGRNEGFHLFLIVIAFVTIALKLISMYKRCQNFYIFLLLYCSYLLFLHDYVQIRVALALGVFVLALYCADSKIIKALLFVVACLIHLSCILLVLFYYAFRILGPKKIIKLLPFALIIPSIVFSGVIPVERITTYINMLGNEKKFDQINLLSTLPILQIIGLLVIYFSKSIKDLSNKFEFSISALGVILFYSLHMIPVFAFRFFEMTNLFFIILLSDGFKKSLYLKLVFVLYILIGLKNSFYGESSLFNLI